MVSQEYIVELASKLIRINSENPPGREFDAASFVADELAKIGMKTVIDKFEDSRANVVGVYGEENQHPSIMLNTHLDTVPAGDREKWSFPPFSGEVRENRICGRGAVDAKGVLASFLGALKELADKGWPIKGRVVLAAVADEEVEGKGTKKLVARGLRTDYAIVGEPTSLNVCIAHKGRVVVQVDFHGRSAHASKPSRGRNAIYYASKFVEKIQKMKFTEKHNLLEHPTCTVTLIRGGVKDNIIPDNCTVTLDLRILPSMKLNQTLKKLKNLIEKDVSKKDYHIRIVNYVPPAETSPSNALVKTALDTVTEVIGKKIGVRGFPATCDMSFLVNQARIPTIILGPGRIEYAHVVDESISVSELVKASQIYLRILEKILS
ncbi:MAG: M20 family metallopeptidase [Thaumarchaeota archaeon]|jgi:acetylornithine deacetylase/succinyl-diaminopimelate desuccinylase family protein|nr:M20 family metallopeptidase [Candidatus Geocrenenecus arthurdayi]MCL7390886.1 M20 family metallopeptidase [Candidatus Geocrenenecus arthurdayi]MCL7403345.1 M20 family metallopeptidase [Candidatus Geocrenenecus arthurdayi]